MKHSYQWPSREEWAKNRRTPYYDLFEDLPVSRLLEDYAMPEEIAAVSRELKTLYSVEGGKMKAVKRVAGSLAQQPGESRNKHWQRINSLTEPEKEFAWKSGQHQETRREINRVLGSMAKGYLPHGGWMPVEIKVILTTIQARYDAAMKAAEEVRLREIEATPIDDAAWAEELRRRAGIEQGPIVRSAFTSQTNAQLSL